MINTNLLPDLNQAQTMLKALAPSNGAFTFQTNKIMPAINKQSNKP